MRNNYFKAICLALGLVLYSCSTEDLPEESQTTTSNPNTNTVVTAKGTSATPTISKKWDFNDLDEWDDATQVGFPNYYIDNDTLHMFTNANTWDRTKIKSTATYTTGTYSWRVFVPEMGVGDCASIGAFLYSDDTHELDFEIGYGSQEDRDYLNAETDDLLVFMTSQANPYHSFQTTIKRNQWYTLSINLAINNKKKYVASWTIDDTLLTSATLTYGTSTKFKIFCSVENLSFIGDHIPTIQNYALFDWVEFK